MKKLTNYCLLLMCGLLIISSCKEKQSDNASQTINVSESVAAPKGEAVSYTYIYKMKSPKDALQPAGKAVIKVTKEAVRSEVELNIPGIAHRKMVMLGFMKEPNITYKLNDKQQTYSVIDAQKIEEDTKLLSSLDKMTEEKVNLLGQENINGYPCTHVQIETSINMPYKLPGVATAMVTDYWLSKEVPGYEYFAQMLKARPQILNTPESKAYEYGIPIKIVIKEGSTINMLMELKEAASITPEKTLFEIPAGYTKSTADASSL